MNEKAKCLKQKLIDANLYYPGPHDHIAIAMIRKLAEECGSYVNFATHAPHGYASEYAYIRTIGEFPLLGAVWPHEFFGK